MSGHNEADNCRKGPLYAVLFAADVEHGGSEQQRKAPSGTIAGGAFVSEEENAQAGTM